MGPGWVLDTVRTGGQTGVDQVALELAQDFAYATGGWVPKGWRTDAGPAPWLGTRYGCKEHWSSSYGPRTDKNTWEADGIIWFGVESPGHKRTLAGYERALKAGHRVFWISNPSVSEMQDFILKNTIRALMVAGNRLSTHPASADKARATMSGGLLPF